METINIDGEIYEYYEYSEDAEINDILWELRQCLNDFDKDIGIKNVIYDIVIFKENKIDAFAVKINSKYLLLISEGTFRELRTWFKMYFSRDDKIYEIFGLKNKNDDSYFKYTYQKALEFLIVHEYAHMIHGHCDIYQNKEKFICEQSKEISGEEGLFSQTLEFHADIWAAAYLTEKIVKKYMSDEAEVEMLKLFVFAIYTVFKKFSDSHKYSFVKFKEDDLLKYTHPIAEIRYRYIMVIILANLPDWSSERKDTLEKELVASFMDFESQILGLKDVKEKLFRMAHTSKGTKHLVRLHNNWNTVATELEAYIPDNHVKLERFVSLGKEAESVVLVDDDGEMI